jgi:hypothetical protein
MMYEPLVSRARDFPLVPRQHNPQSLLETVPWLTLNRAHDPCQWLVRVAVGSAPSSE